MFLVSTVRVSYDSGLCLKSGSLISALGAGVYVTLLPAASTSSDLCSALRAGKLYIALFYKTNSA